MKRKLIGVCAFLTSLAAQATLLTWNNAGSDVLFANPDNWSPVQAPSSNVDSIILDNSAGVAQLSSEFRIGSGQSMTAQNSPSNDLVMRIASGGNLIVGTGGTLDLLTGGQQGGINEGGSGETFTVEAGATVRMYRYWNDEVSYVNKFIADASGVSTVEIQNNFALRGTGSSLEVDLSNYNLANGNSLVLFDYGNLLLQSQAPGDVGWGSVTLSPGWTADVDLAYDIDGDTTHIALVNIIPEPATTGLLGLGALVSVVLRRKRI